MKPLPLFIIFSIIGLVVFALGLKLYDACQSMTVHCATVKELKEQQKIRGTGEKLSTEIRFIIITDKGTFTSEDAIMKWKFNNSDIFYNLKKDSSYNFVVAGIGKGLLTDYQNIISVQSCIR